MPSSRGWLLEVVSSEENRYRRWHLTLSCGCVVTRTAMKKPKRARCELQRGCKWRTEGVAHAG